MICGLILGATGVGKSNLAGRLAERLNASIISADSRQIYKGLSIGTGQPLPIEKGSVQHHLLDFVSPRERYSVGEFLRTVQKIESENPQKKYLVVGGTGFYQKAVAFGLNDIPSISPEIEEEVKGRLEKEGLISLHQGLESFDEISFKRLEASDSQRIFRAWCVYLQTGKSWSSYVGQNKPLFGDIPVLFFDRPREELYARINLRVESMLALGWVAEVKGLLEQGFSLQDPALNSLGYREFGEHWQETKELEMPKHLVEEVQKKTRNFAKRQLTFFRNQFPQAHHIDLSKETSLETLLSLLKKGDV